METNKTKTNQCTDHNQKIKMDWTHTEKAEKRYSKTGFDMEHSKGTKTLKPKNT